MYFPGVISPGMLLSEEPAGGLTGQARIKEESVSDHLDRAAEVLWEATCPDGLRAAMRPDCWAMAQALDAAGLLVTPEHDAAVAAKAWDEGFKQGGPMHDVNYDDPDAHTRNPYERADRIEKEAGELNEDT